MLFRITAYYFVNLNDKRIDWICFDATHAEPIKDVDFRTLKWVDSKGEVHEYREEIFVRYSAENRSVRDSNPKFEVDNSVVLMGYSRLWYTNNEGEWTFSIGKKEDQKAYIIHIETRDNEFGQAEPLYTIAIMEEGDTINKVKNFNTRLQVYESCLTPRV
jgi:hypothetical protein